LATPVLGSDMNIDSSTSQNDAVAIFCLNAYNIQSVFANATLINNNQHAEECFFSILFR